MTGTINCSRPLRIVSLCGEKLATRKGKVVLLEDILSEAIKKTLKIIEEKIGMDEAEELPVKWALVL